MRAYLNRGKKALLMLGVKLIATEAGSNLESLAGALSTSDSSKGQRVEYREHGLLEQYLMPSFLGVF
jgi:hypothetical protein